jgi:NAD(P)-dependent dehydrogenase (short-subunit alcohol dehydrogenase family)
MAEKPIALVTGVGSGTGSAIVRRFASDGFRVIALARSADVISVLERKLPDTHAAQCDVTDERQVRDTVVDIHDRFGSPSVLIHNAVGQGLGTFLEIDPKTLEASFRVDVMGLLYLTQQLAPAVIKAARGTIMVMGDRSATRGEANLAGSAPTKAAQRILAESIARELGPHGVHVAYVVVHAVIDTPAMRKRFPAVSNAFFAKPSAIADELWHLNRQDRSAWSFLTELRPFGEKW